MTDLRFRPTGNRRLRRRERGKFMATVVHSGPPFSDEVRKVAYKFLKRRDTTPYEDWTPLQKRMQSGGA